MRMKLVRRTAWLVAMILFLGLPDTRAAEESAGSPVADRFETATEIVRVRTAWSVDGARPGAQVVLAIVVDIEEGYHINPDVSQLTSLKDFKPYPTRVQVIEAADEITVESVHFPPAHPVAVSYARGELMSYGGQTIFYVPMKVDEQTKPGLLKLRVKIEYQACDAEMCLFPQTAILPEALQVVESDQIIKNINADLFAGYHALAKREMPELVWFDLFGWRFSLGVSSFIGWSLLLLVAAIGGMLLNFTPCVLPVIPIKIISLSNASENRKECFSLGVFMFLGVLVFWIALGGMIAFISEFTATNQLFHYPAFTILIGIVIAIMALGMGGLFYIRLPNFVYKINPAWGTFHGSFGLGMMTAILSTPCTAPFMGAAAAWAAVQNVTTTLCTFSAIGAGMALPYLVLSASPALVQKMPRTGPVSVLIKQVMGLFMLATAAYFAGVGTSGLLATPPDPPSKAYWWPVMGGCMAAGGWLAWRTLWISSGKKTRIFFSALGLTIVVLAVFGAVRLTNKGPIDWVCYTPERLEEAARQGKIVVMEFTAEWCLNCKALEEGVLKTPPISRLFAGEDIVPIKVDITYHNPPGKAKLKEVGSLTIPLLVIYAPDGSPVFKSDFYTADQVSRAINQARKKRP